MARPPSWLRRFGTALTALVLAIIVFGPSLDRLICRDDTALGAQAAERVVSVTTAHDGASHPDNAPEVCMHGHCHHGPAAAPLIPEALLTTIAPVRDHHPLLRTRVRTADAKFDLMRPPRA